MKNLVFAALLASVVAVPAQAAMIVQNLSFNAAQGAVVLAQFNPTLGSLQSVAVDPTFSGFAVLEVTEPGYSGPFTTTTSGSASWTGPAGSQNAAISGITVSDSPYASATGTTSTLLTSNLGGFIGAGTLLYSLPDILLNSISVTNADGDVPFRRRFCTGRGCGFDAISGTVTYNYIAATVPEPATWAMMLVGFGAIGGAMRRRKPNVAVYYA